MQILYTTARLTYLDHLSVVVKNPSDFTGSVLGESEKNTKGILNNSVGKVLVIDEVTSETDATYAVLIL